MLNKKDDTRKVLFIDVDGVIVYHNYDPENIPDVPIEKTIKYLKELEDVEIVLTTSRRWEHIHPVIQLLSKEGIEVHTSVVDLPTGQRTLINDIKNKLDEPKAVAINIERDAGVSRGTGCNFYKKWGC